MSQVPDSCHRCHAPLPVGGSGICAACSVGNLFGIEAPLSPAPQGKPEGLLDEKYQLGEVLGEGGFGIVYHANQVAPVKRDVAIKILKQGTDRARFEAEGQALASLNHPGIAKVYDSGIDENGAPFLAMEFFPGKPVTVKNRTLDENLHLFTRICEAVQHAHQRGIIHRDLKPSNVLVNDDGEFKIIDFGIAKATSHLLTEKTLLTGMHQFVGTPGYVSPEQAGMKGRDVDTRSDIYSLGALLHEMLTGEAPFGKRLEKAASFSEILAIIQQEEPPRPGKIPADLGWIILRALHKNPDERYSSASELARDVHRVINHQPIEARAPGRLYRIRKFIFRNKAASVAILGLLAGFVLATFGLVRAREEAREAQVQAERASAVVQLINEMFSATDPALARNSNYTVRQLLDDYATTFAGKLDEQPEVELSLQRTLANAYQGLSEHQTAEIHYRRTLELGKKLSHPDLSTFESELARCLRDQGRYQDALNLAGSISDSLSREVLIVELHRLLGEKEKSHQLALALVAQVSAPRHLTILALTFAEVGEYSRAENLAKKALSETRKEFGNENIRLIPPLQTLAEIADLQKQTEEVLQHRKAALKLARDHLQPDHPTRIYAESRVAEVAPASDKDDLKLLANRLLARAGSKPETFKPLLKFGARLFAEGRSGEAIDLLTDLLRIDYNALTSGDTVTFQMGGSLIGDIVSSGQIPDFIPIAEEAHEVASELFGNDGIHTVELKRVLAYMYRWDDRFDDSLAIGREAFDLTRFRYGEDHGTTVNCLINQVETLWDIGDEKAAMALLVGDLDGSRSPSETVRAMEKAADYFWNLSRRRIAETLYQNALTHHRESKPDSHPDCARLLSRLVELEYSGRWFRQSNSELFEEAYDASVRANGIASSETATLASWIGADRGRFLGLPESVSFLEENLKKAQLAKAPQSIAKIYAAKLRMRQNELKDYQREFDSHLKKFKNDSPLSEKRRNHRILIECAFAQGKIDLAEQYLALAPERDSLGLRIAEAQGYWRCKELEKAEELVKPLLPFAFQKSPLTLTSRQKILHTKYRIHWDRDETARYWNSLDKLADELLETSWPTEQTELLIPRHTRWVCHAGTSPPHPDWMAPRHDFEVSWARGQAPFCDYRFPDIKRLTYRTNNRVPSARFRHRFEVSSLENYQKLKLRLTYPAGFILYLNGKEILRKHLPDDASTVSYGRKASFSLPLGSEVIELPVSHLIEGDNTLAIQVHRKNDRSSLYFDLQLEALIASLPTEPK